MIRVAQPADPLEAQHLLGVLEEHGIRAIVQGEALWAARGELPFGPESAPSLWVTDEADAERARQILAEHKSPLIGTPGTWTCPNCQEEIEAQFTHCWSCGAEKSDRAISSPRDDRRPTAEPAQHCARCGGTGYVERQLTPAILIVCGLFLGFAALRNAFENAPHGAFRVDSFLPRALFALAAVLCLYFARMVRRTPCPCRDD